MVEISNPIFLVGDGGKEWRRHFPKSVAEEQNPGLLSPTLVPYP